MTEKRIKIILDTTDARGSARALDKEMASVGKTADGVQSSLTKVAAAVVAALSVRELGRYADAWTTVGNRIRQATNTIAEYEAVQARVFQIAQSGRVDVEGVAAAFQRIDNAVKETGASQSDVIDVVDGLTKAFAANGATAAEVSSTLVQLSQGLGAGRLNGDELRAVMEASLPVARAIAKEFGVNVGQLKDLGEAGELVTDRVFKAIKSELPAFQAAFDQAIPTIASSITVADNSLTKFIGTFNEATGIGEAVAVAIRDIAGALDELSTLIDAGVFGEFGNLFSGQIERALAASSQFANQFGITQDQMLLASKAWSSEITQLLKDAFLNAVPNVTAFIQIATVNIAAFADDAAVRLKNAFNIEAYIKGKFGGDLTEEIKAVNAELARIEGVRQQTVNAILATNEAEKKRTADTIEGAKLKIKEYELELQLNNELLSVERKRTAVQAPDKKAQAEVVKVQKRITAGESRADDIFAGREEKSDVLNQSLELENELIRKSLETRASLYATYGATINDINAGYFEQQRARLELSIAEQAAREQEQLQKELAALSERRTAIQNETELTEFGRVEALRALDEQIILQKQTTEQRLTEIQDEGRAARAALDQLEFNNKIAMAGQLGNALISFGQGQSKEIFNIGKKLALAQAAISLPTAVIESFKNGGGYPWGLIPAAAMAAQGLQQINAIRSTTFDGGGAGGASIGGGAGGTSSQPVPQLPQQQEQVQSLSIIGSDSLKRELEEYAAADGVIPARTMLRYLNSVESARRIGS